MAYSGYIQLWPSYTGYTESQAGGTARAACCCCASQAAILVGAAAEAGDAKIDMFESPEEVKKAMMDLKIFEAIEPLGGEEREEEGEEEEYAPQVS